MITFMDVYILKLKHENSLFSKTTVKLDNKCTIISILLLLFEAALHKWKTISNPQS